MNKRPIYDVLMRALAKLQRSQFDERADQIALEICVLFGDESLRSSLDFDPDTEIAIIWSVEDVTEVCPNLTPEQAILVLRLVKTHHDACGGVNWDVIKRWTETFLDIESAHTRTA